MFEEGEINGGPRRGNDLGYLADFASDALTIRSWERANLPQFKPQIALDILLYSIVTSAAPQPRPTKGVHLDIGYSQDRVRETIRALVDGDWLLREPCTRDRRVVGLQPTDHTIRLIRKYENCVGHSIRPRT